jgi:hypothetical protein
MSQRRANRLTLNSRQYLLARSRRLVRRRNIAPTLASPLLRTVKRRRASCGPRCAADDVDARAGHASLERSSNTNFSNRRCSRRRSTSPILFLNRLARPEQRLPPQVRWRARVEVPRAPDSWSVIRPVSPIDTPNAPRDHPGAYGDSNPSRPGQAASRQRPGCAATLSICGRRSFGCDSYQAAYLAARGAALSPWASTERPIVT